MSWHYEPYKNQRVDRDEADFEAEFKNLNIHLSSRQHLSQFATLRLWIVILGCILLTSQSQLHN
jgi:hypothetical protein